MADRVLTRYDEVLAALKEPRLVQTGEAGPIDEGEQKRKRAEMLAALPAARVDAWRMAILPLALQVLDGLPEDRPVDLVGEFVRPWCAAIAPVIMEAPLKALQTSLTDTLPAFLASALLAMLESKGSLEATPRTVEELLRHAGTVHTLLRTAKEDVKIGGASIEAGERIVLKVAEANHDESRFAEPDELDPGRREGGHLALGAGEHACAGAVVVRMATAVMLEALSSRLAGGEVAGPVEWYQGATKRWPKKLPALLRRLPSP